MRAFFKEWRWEVGCIALVMALAGGAVFWFHHSREPFRESVKILDLIRSMDSRRPPEVTEGKWACAVGWTCTLHANSLDAFEADAASLRTFREEMARKLDGPVSMETIQWIWDSYAELCRGGANYQKWRSVMMDEIAHTQ